MTALLIYLAALNTAIAATFIWSTISVKRDIRRRAKDLAEMMSRPMVTEHTMPLSSLPSDVQEAIKRTFTSLTEKKGSN